MLCTYRYVRYACIKVLRSVRAYTTPPYTVKCRNRAFCVTQYYLSLCVPCNRNLTGVKPLVTI